MRHALEEYKIFPILMWTIIILGIFALYKMSENFSYKFNYLGEKQNSNEKALEIDLYQDELPIGQ